MDEIQAVGEGKEVGGEIARTEDPAKGLAIRIYRDVMGLMTRKRSKMMRGYAAEGERIWEETKPRDGIERMMVSHMIWTHARMAYLSRFATRQKNFQWSELMNRQCESAAASFNKQLTALLDYRNPKRGRSFTAIKQANIARSQRIIGGDVVDAD